MKYSEFKEWLLENDWDFFNQDDHISVTNVLSVSKQDDNYILTFKDYFSNERSLALLKKSIELAETPIEDREDEKYYTVKLPFLNHENKKMSLRRSFTEPYWCTEFSSRFTEKEIKELDPRLWEFVVEVEDERD